MRYGKEVIILLLIVCLSNISFSGEVRTITLENGLDLVLMPDASTPLLSSLIIVRTGSSFENLSTAGSTHMLEHMLFRGTETRTQGEIYDAMDLMGAYYNAQTSKTYTNYILVVPNEHALQAMQIQADMILHSNIPADTFDVEKGRVIAEIEQSYNRSSYPAEVAHLRNVYGTTPYSFPTLSSANGIRQLTRDTVAKFHDDWYAVNNMTLVLKGDLNFEEMEKLANEVYGSEPAKKLPERPESWPVGFDDWHQGRNHISYGDVRSGTVTVSFQAPGFDDVDYPAYTLIQNFVDNELEKALQKQGPPLVTYVYSDITNDPDFSVLNITASLLPGTDAEDVINKIITTVHEFSQYQFSDESLIMKYEENKRDELFFGEQVQYGSFLLVPKLALAPYGLWEVLDNQRSLVRSKEATDAANRWFSEPYYVASAYLPRPDALDQAGVSLGDLLADTLDNGMIILARQIDGTPVTGIHLVVKHRSLWEGDERRGWVDILHRILTNGYGDADQDALNMEMNEIGMELSSVDDPRVPMDNYRTIPDYSFIRIQVIADRWAAAMRLLGKMIESPRITDENISLAKTEQKGIITRGQGKLSSRTMSDFKHRLYGNHYITSKIYGDASSHKTLDSNSLKELYDISFSPDNLVISILSPAPNEEVIEVAKSIFGEMPSTRFKPPATVIPESQPGVSEATGSGRQGFLASGFLIQNLPKEDIPALMIANSMVSDLIYRDLGEKKGWAYGAGSRLETRDGWGAFYVSMGLPEEHLKESRDIVYQHLATITSGDFDEHRMEVARQSLLGKTLRRYSSRINLAMALGNDAALHDNPLFTWELYDQLKAVSLKQVKKTASKYLAPSKNEVTVYGKPEATEETMPKMPGMMRGMKMK
ncbi:MAG: insulinase family protein [Candidatus Electryonea clarkiae]|nr:insulinase family protein [Candidatus Electryonea clarkiae]MDP8287096.1 insulinase family protein [Candidatus Electryonea clarkiae]